MLRIEDRDAVRVVTIDRPERKNALSQAMRLEIMELCQDFDADETVRVLVLTAVDPIFTAGVDIKELPELAGKRRDTDPAAALRAVRKPTLCAINGPCVTGGLELALACDLRVASERARFVDTHARLGGLPGWGLSAMLPRVVGLAKEMTLTGNFVDADEALRIGLVNHVVAHESLMARALGLAADIASSNQPAVLASKALYDTAAFVSMEEALQLEREARKAFRVDVKEFAGRREEVARRGSQQVGSRSSEGTQ